MTDELQHRLDEAARETRQLREAFDAYRELSIQDRERVSKVEHKTARQTTVLLAVVLAAMVFLGSLIAWNRITLQQAQRQTERDLTAQIVTCFLRPGDASRAQAEECARRNGGDLYRRRQAESAEAVRRFLDLQRWAAERGWTPPTTTTRPPPDQ